MPFPQSRPAGLARARNCPTRSVELRFSNRTAWFGIHMIRSKPREEGKEMLALLVHWLLSALALLIVSRIVPGFHVHGLGPALIASLVIGLLNATLGLFLKIITFPLTILTLGIFLLVINGAMILIASDLVPGFHVYGWGPAFWSAVVLALLGMLIRAIRKDA
jgi:putative membrane protein